MAKEVSLDPKVQAMINSSRANSANTFARMNGNSTLPAASIWPNGSLPNMQGASNSVQTLPLIKPCNVFSCGGTNYTYGGNVSLATAMNITAQTNALINQCNNNVMNAQFNNVQNANNNQQQINLSDITNRFNNINEKKLSDMANMETKISTLNTIFDKLDNGQELTDAEKKELEAMKLTEESKEADKEKVAAALNALKDAYRKLDSEYGDLSLTYGDEFKFYGNLDKLELGAIQKQNKKIEGLRKDLEQKQTKLQELKEELTVKAQEAAKKSGKPVTAWSDFCSNDEKNRYDKLEEQISKIQQQISDAINENSAYIKQAGKNTNVEQFESFKVKHEREIAAEKKENADAQTSTELANSFFDSEGNVVNITGITNKLNSMEGYDNADKTNVARFIHRQIGTKTKEEFLQYLTDDKFFSELQKSTKPNFMTNNDNLKLLRDVYDKLSKTTLEDAVKDAPQLSSKAAIKTALERLKKSEETSSTESTAKKETTGFDANKTITELIKNNTKDDKTIDWDSIKTKMHVGTYTDEEKAALTAEYKKQRTTAEIKTLIANAQGATDFTTTLKDLYKLLKAPYIDKATANELIKEATIKAATKSFTQNTATQNNIVKAAQQLRTDFPNLTYEECKEIIKSKYSDELQKIPFHTNTEIKEMLEKGSTAMSANDLIRYFSEAEQQDVTDLIQNLKNDNKFETIKDVIAKLNKAADTNDNTKRICFDQDWLSPNEVHYEQPFDDKVEINDDFNFKELDMGRCVRDVTQAVIEMSKALKQHLEF